MVIGALAVCLVLALIADSSDPGPTPGRGEATTLANAKSDPAVAPNVHQKRAGKLRPKPSKATKDKSRMFDQGCQADAPEVTSKRCVYGARKSKTTVALIGDSHALMYFPALNRVAKQRGWRLVALSKVGCPPFSQLVYNRRVGRGYRECLKWHRYVFKRLSKSRPDLVVTSGWIWHKAMRKGKIVPRTTVRNRRMLRTGYTKFLRKMRKSTGAQLAVMKDPPKAPHAIPPCVQKNRNRLGRCAFKVKRSHDRQSFEKGVVKRVKHARLVNLAPVFCPKRRCHAVIRNRIVYRDNNHLTATYSRQLWRQLGQRLPSP